MIVAVEKGLVNLKNYLAKHGFDAVYYGEFYGGVDAVVYKGAASPLQSFSPVSGNGVLFVNCNGKTPFQVAEILSNRLYSPLF